MKKFLAYIVAKICERSVKRMARERRRSRQPRYAEPRDPMKVEAAEWNQPAGSRSLLLSAPVYTCIYSRTCLYSDGENTRRPRTDEGDLLPVCCRSTATTSMLYYRCTYSPVTPVLFVTLCNADKTLFLLSGLLRQRVIWRFQLLLTRVEPSAPRN